jgi:hypothetical protein
MIFCKGTKKNMRCVLIIFTEYGVASGQLVSNAKSKFYAGSISNSRLVSFSSLLGFSIGCIPFSYLGCPIFVGNPKALYFQALADRIKTKLATWKGSHFPSWVGCNWFARLSTVCLFTPFTSICGKRPCWNDLTLGLEILFGVGMLTPVKYALCHGKKFVLPTQLGDWT